MSDPQRKYDFDLFVIGAGSGGVRASRIAAKYGAKVAVAEESRVGGTCVIRGCIPKKLFWYAAEFAHEFSYAENYGWGKLSHTIDWPKLKANKNAEIQRLNGIYINLLKSSGVTLLEGRAKLLDAHTVEVKSDKYTAETILIATGSWPWTPELPGIEHTISSNEALELDQLPKSLVIVGSGYIACEFAGIFTGLGVKVTQIFRAERVLRGFDIDVQKTVMEDSARLGINLLHSTIITKIDKTDSGYRVYTDHGEPIDTELVFYATGRKPNTKGLGLEMAGVSVTKEGAVIVDEWSRSNVPNIYAVGDVTNRIQLTPMALAEGHALADTLYGKNPRLADHTDVPSAVFTTNPVSTVGLTEEAAEKQFGKAGIDVYYSKFTPLLHTLTKAGVKSMMKLIVDNKTDKVVGAHMVGDYSPEIVQGLAIAIKCGATKKQLDSTIGIHPTAAEEFVTMRTKRD